MGKGNYLLWIEQPGFLRAKARFVEEFIQSRALSREQVVVRDYSRPLGVLRTFPYTPLSNDYEPQALSREARTVLEALEEGALIELAGAHLYFNGKPRGEEGRCHVLGCVPGVAYDIETDYLPGRKIAIAIRPELCVAEFFPPEYSKKLLLVEKVDQDGAAICRTSL